MAGFGEINGGLYGSVMNADNVSFDGTAFGGVVTTNGQLLIGSTVAPHIRVGNLTSNAGTISITNGAGTINLDLASGSPAIESINLQTGTTPIVPVAGAITFNGAVVAAGTHPVRTDGTNANTVALEVQKSQAIASADATKIGLAAFSSAYFTVDANGFVTISGTVITQVNVQTFTTSGTYTPSASMKYCVIEVQAAGGGSGGVPAPGAGFIGGSGGGGGGGYSRGICSAATIGVSQTVTVGSGGTAGTTAPTNGGDGGSSSVGTLVTATGGGGGIAGNGSVSNYLGNIGGGAGGTGAGTSSNFAVTGGGGSSPFGLYAATFGTVMGGWGGNSYFAGGRAPGVTGTSGGSLTGFAGSNYGGGAAGGAVPDNGTAKAGAAGAGGIVVITEFI